MYDVLVRTVYFTLHASVVINKVFENYSNFNIVLYFSNIGSKSISKLMGPIAINFFNLSRICTVYYRIFKT
jgi:hypothetical protein